MSGSTSDRVPAIAANIADSASRSTASDSGAPSAITDTPAPPSSLSITRQAARAGASLVAVPSAVGAVSGFLTGLGNFLGLTPGSGGFADVVLAGLNDLRRQIQNLIFKTPPTAVPEQWAQTADKLVAGTVGATDAEFDTLAYSVIQAPQHGSVEVGTDGTFVYTAESAFSTTGGTDTFTVGVTETGLPNDFGIFSFFARTTPVAVTVSMTPAASRPVLGASPGSGAYTTAFNVYNLSSKTMVYAGEGQGYYGSLDSGPEVGKTYGQGQFATFNVVRTFLGQDKSLQRIELVDPAGGTNQFQLVLFETNGWSGSTSATCFGGTATCTAVGNDIWILDPVGTTYNLTADQKEEQSAVLKLCDNGGPARCTFTAGKLVKGTLFSDPVQASKNYVNYSTNYVQQPGDLVNPQASVNESTEISVGVSATLGVSFFSVVSAELTAEVGASWSEGRSFTDAGFYSVYAPPKKLATEVTLADGTVLPAGTVLPDAGYPSGTYRSFSVWFVDPINRKYLGGVVKLGNTTWNLPDIYIDFPDKTRMGDWVPRTTIVLGGNAPQPGGTVTDPVVVVPDGWFATKPLVLPKGTTFLAFDQPPLPQ